MGSIEISSRLMARRKTTRSGSSLFAIVLAERPLLRKRSTQSWMSALRTSQTFRRASGSVITYFVTACAYDRDVLGLPERSNHDPSVIPSSNACAASPTVCLLG